MSDTLFSVKLIGSGGNEDSESLMIMHLPVQGILRRWIFLCCRPLKVQEWVSFKGIDLGGTTLFKDMNQAAKNAQYEN